MADQFFTSPDVSVRGWERAVDAQARVVRAVEEIVRTDRSTGSIAIVSHGAVRTLLYCRLSGYTIERRWDHPVNGGGNYFSFSTPSWKTDSWWRAIDEPVSSEVMCNALVPRVFE